jgi:hypothetical protein
MGAATGESLNIDLEKSVTSNPTVGRVDIEPRGACGHAELQELLGDADHEKELDCTRF